MIAAGATKADARAAIGAAQNTGWGTLSTRTDRVSGTISVCLIGDALMIYGVLTTLQAVSSTHTLAIDVPAAMRPVEVIRFVCGAYTFQINSFGVLQTLSNIPVGTTVPISAVCRL